MKNTIVETEPLKAAVETREEHTLDEIEIPENTGNWQSTDLRTLS
ncbi:MAG: hypothetical protein NTZ38_01570 [Candidatus Taylorbacteria bacterium]|nr:hypothetical protein [Candidatus Taylorbacteria bacterium]